jgi:hypothetical protein
MEFEAPLPDDFQKALDAIREHRTKPIRRAPVRH